MQSNPPAGLRRWSELNAGILLLALAATVATGALPILLVGLASLALLVVTRRPRHARVFGLGVANAVTLGRLLLAVTGVLLARRSLAAFGVLALVGFALDGVDGWLARRFGEADELGSLFDMETDAYVALLLSAALVVVGGEGAWVLLAGAVRYVFVLARWLVDPPPSPERRSRAGRWIFFALMSSLVVSCFPVASGLRTASLAAGVVLVLVSFATDFRLLARVTWRPRAIVVLGVLLDLLLFVPWTLFREGAYFPGSTETHLAPGIYPETVLHVSVEWLVLLAVVALFARTRLARTARGVGAVLYSVFLLFLVYHQGYLYFYRRPPALVSDVHLLVRLFHFLLMDPKWAVLLGACLCCVALFCVLAGAFLERVQAIARGAHARHVLFGLFVALCGCVASLRWSGIENDRPVVQLLARHVMVNVQFSRMRLETQRVFAASPPDLRYETFLHPIFRRTPNVHLLMVEAYGEVLATSDMRDAYRGALDDLQERLARKGHSFASAYSKSPIHSGFSWLAISTVQTGVRIDDQVLYDALEGGAARVPSLTSFLRAQGYHTMALEPGNRERTGLRHFDLFGRDTVVEAPALEYRGPRYGWGEIPDQYSLGFFRERFLRAPPEPRFVFFMSVSTHYDWTGTPPYAADWHALGEAGAPPSVLKTQPGVERIASEARRRYFRSVAYDLASLGDYIEGEGETDAVFFILGDHQPKVDGADGSSKTPLHVISRDKALVDRFAARGFGRGLFVDPKATATIAHEGFFSLVASILAEHTGATETLKIYPDGISQSGLKR